MKKTYILALTTLFTINSFSQSSQSCIVTVNSNSTGNKCFGDCKGTATAVPQGTGSYSYGWSNGAGTQSVTGLCAGTYTVTVKDLGDGTNCSNTFTITQPPKLTAATSSNNISVSCSGKCDATATIIATGGTGAYTYSWLFGGQTTATVTGLCSVPYQCDVTDANGCKASVTVIPSSPAPLNVTATPGGGTATANPTGGTSPYTYSWNPTGQTTQTATGLGNGNYTVTLTDKNGCSKTATVNVTSLGVTNPSNGSTINIYPNPVSNFVTIESTNDNPTTIKILVTNLIGETLFEDSYNAGKLFKKSVDTSKLPIGVYFITVKSQTASVTQKMVKE